MLEQSPQASTFSLLTFFPYLLIRNKIALSSSGKTFVFASNWKIEIKSRQSIKGWRSITRYWWWWWSLSDRFLFNDKHQWGMAALKNKWNERKQNVESQWKKGWKDFSRHIPSNEQGRTSVQTFFFQESGKAFSMILIEKEKLRKTKKFKKLIEVRCCKSKIKGKWKILLAMMLPAIVCVMGSVVGYVLAQALSLFHNFLWIELRGWWSAKERKCWEWC